MLQGRVARGLPDEVREPLGSLATDAQTAIQFVRSAPGVTTALVGMSNVEHVEENLKLAQVEPVGPTASVKFIMSKIATDRLLSSGPFTFWNTAGRQRACST